MSKLDTIFKLVELFQKYKTTAEQVLKVVDYLQHYGYLIKTDTLTPEDVVEAIKQFQEIFGLLKDGLLGPKTFKAMFFTPRCGCSDAAMLEARLEVQKWGTKKLTYFIEKRDTDLPVNTWDDIIAQSFNAWSEVADLEFTRVLSSNNANFVLSVGSGRRDNFDGPGNTLAWAYLPPRNNYNGQLLMKHDIAETWSVYGSRTGIYLLNVTTHEVGHLLGLDHSRVSSALMAPYYSPNVYKPTSDDIARIQGLYGKPQSNPVPKPNPTPEPKPTPGSLTITLTGEIYDISIPGYRVQKTG